MRLRRGTGYSHDGASGIGIPKRSGKSGQGRHEIYPATVLDAACKFLYLRRLADDAQPVAKPLDRSPGHEYASFESVGHFVADLPSDGSEQVTGGRYGAASRVHQQESACPVGVLYGACIYAHLSEKRGLLVPGHTAYRHFHSVHFRLAVQMRTRQDLRQHTLWYVQKAE